MHGILLRVVRWLCRSVHRKIELPRKTKHFKTNCVITFSIFKVDQDDYPLSVDKKGVVTDILHHTLCFIVDIKWKPFLFLRQANDNWWTAVGQWETVKGRRVVLCVQYETKSSFFFSDDVSFHPIYFVYFRLPPKGLVFQTHAKNIEKKQCLVT